MNRKAVAYTLVCFILLFVIGSIFYVQNRRTGHESFSVANERVRTMDNFIRNLEVDSQRAAYIAGFRTLIAMEQEVTTSGAYFADADSAFIDIFFSGNLSGTLYEIMENSTFSSYVERVAYEAAKQGIITNVTVTNTTLWQEDPWHILVNYTFAIELTDAQETAEWDISRTFTGRIPIVDLRDPLFTKNTLARVQREIHRTNITEFVDDVNDANDTTGLMTHYNNSFYTSFGRGPSMLMRFEGNLSDSEFGFESLVIASEFVDQDLIVLTSNSIVDYQYFSGVSATVCDIQNTLPAMKLSNADLINYEVDGKLYYDPC